MEISINEDEENFGKIESIKLILSDNREVKDDGKIIVKEVKKYLLEEAKK